MGTPETSRQENSMKHDGTLTVTKIYEFAYAHRLPAYAGKCVNLHGHTGRLEVEVAGQPGPGYPGIVVDFHDLKDMMAGILAEVDHACLNDVLNAPRYAAWAQAHLDPVQDEDGQTVYATTAENMVLWVLHRLRTTHADLDVRRIRWWESSTSYAEWRAGA